MASRKRDDHDSHLEVLRAIWQKMKALNARVDKTNERRDAVRVELKQEMAGVRTEVRDAIDGQRQRPGASCGILAAFCACFLAGVALLAACGGGRARTPTKAGAGDAGAREGGAQLVTSPPPSGLPTMAVMPLPGVAGSKRAKKRADAVLAACGGATRPHAKDPADHVKRIGEGCASASKMKPTSTMMRGQQGDKDAHQENTFHAEANHCYRLYFAGDETVKDVVIVLRDSAGDVVAVP